MSRQLRVVAVIGNPRSGSRTRTLAQALASALVPSLQARGATLSSLEVVELADVVGVSFGAATAPAAAPKETPEALTDPFATVREADLLIVATPTYKGTYTGLLKVFLDQFPGHALEKTVAISVGLAASEAHRDVVGHDLDRVLSELGASVPARPFTLLESDLAHLERVVDAWVSAHAEEVALGLLQTLRSDEETVAAR